MIVNALTNLKAVAILGFALVCTCITAGNANAAEAGAYNPTGATDPRYNQFSAAIEEIYKEAGLYEKMDQEVFELSIIGYYNLKKRNLLKKHTPITIIDYRKPSAVERLHVIDLESRSVLYSSLVAHGKNSGDEQAQFFSNEPGSCKSSIGFYVTAGTYTGKHGYSLKLKGVDAPFNTNAKCRRIVIHGADYVSKKHIEKNGKLGRSWGCPALPKKLSKEIIEVIKDGSCLFIYFDDKSYRKKSQLLEVDTALQQFFSERKPR